MKVLLDEHFSPAIAVLLRERGLDAQAVVEQPDLIEALDRDILDRATKDGRAVVTNNIKDFRLIAAERLTDGRDHAGLILVSASHRRRRNDVGRPADAIEAVMHCHPNGIAGSERWLAPDG
ncbi:MAG TPA: DUF5615 family PIN-like protein [Solirubrobacteraceae bacterium]|nr:DUF5615 family PIN-like protein [Solirubrobacteraceae bacterium]